MNYIRRYILKQYQKRGISFPPFSNPICYKNKKQTMKTITEKTENLIKDVESFIKEYSRGYDNTDYIVLNVKIHNPLFKKLLRFDDLDSLVNEFTFEQMVFIKENLTEKEFCNMFTDFLEGQCEQTISFANGYEFDSDEDLKRIHFRILENQLTGYINIDRKKTINLRLREFQKVQLYNYTGWNTMSMLKTKKDVGFHGRSGGWLSICKTETIIYFLENVIDDLKNLKETTNEKLKKHNEKILKNSINRLYEVFECAKWLYKEYEKMYSDIPENWKFEFVDYYLPNWGLNNIEQQKTDVEI